MSYALRSFNNVFSTLAVSLVNVNSFPDNKAIRIKLDSIVQKAV